MRTIASLAVAVSALTVLTGCDRTSPTAVDRAFEPQYSGGPAGTEYHPNTPSQMVACNLVDNKLSQIPHGDGDGVVTDDELGPGGWRFNGGGRSFVTFNQMWTGAQYDSDAGRSNVGLNSGIINDYPEFLDSPQLPQSDQLVFGKQHGEIVLSGGDEFQLPGQENGQVRITMQYVGVVSDGRIYEGCAKTPQLTNFGFTVKEGGDFVQQEYFKAWARTNGDYEVLEYEWTQVSTFNNTNPDAS